MHVPRRVLGGVTLAAFALVCAIVATAIDYWYVYDKGECTSEGTSVYIGIWEICQKNSAQDLICSTVSDIAKMSEGGENWEWLKTCEAMMILGVVSLAAAAILPIIPAIPRWTAAVAAFAGGLFCLIAFSVFAAKYDEQHTKSDGGNLHACFALAILASGAGFLASVLLFLSKDDD